MTDQPKRQPFRTSLTEPATWFASLSLGGKIWAGIAGALAAWAFVSPLIWYHLFHAKEHIAILTSAGIAHAELEDFTSRSGLEEAARLFVIAAFDRGPGGIEHQRTLAALTDRNVHNKVLAWQSSRSPEFHEGQLHEFARLEKISLLGQGPAGAQIELVGQLVRYGVSGEGLKFHPDPLPFVLTIYVSPTLDLVRQNRWPYQVRAILLNVDGKNVI